MNLRAATQFEASLRRLVALQLWVLGAVKVQIKNPFRLVSGNYSPIYINCRRLISFPTFIQIFGAASHELLQHQRVKLDGIAGGETAGIPFAAFLATMLNRPMVYVRKAMKTHGIATPIEGASVANWRVLLVEDLITNAGSKLGFIGALTDAGATVKDVLVVFDRLQGGREALKKRGIRLHALTDMNEVLSVGHEGGIISPRTFRAVGEYLKSPQKWHKRQGLEYLA